MYSVSKIYRAFGSRLVGNDYANRLICQTLLIFPDKIIKYVTENVWFFSSMDEAWGYTFNGKDLKNKHLVFLSDDLLNQDESQIRYTIAHEIGHVILGHRNAYDRGQSYFETLIQERQADYFARNYLSKFQNKFSTWEVE